MSNNEYDFSVLPSVSLVNYNEWELIDIRNDLMQNAELSAQRTLIVEGSAKWIGNCSILDALRELESICDAVHDRWSNLQIHIIGLVDDVSLILAIFKTHNFRDLTKVERTLIRRWSRLAENHMHI
jgi:hypothetical protein